MTATQVENEIVPEVPRALRTGASAGQGVAALVIAVGAALLMNATGSAQSAWGVALLIAGVVLLAAVETWRVMRRRRASAPDPLT